MMSCNLECHVLVSSRTPWLHRNGKKVIEEFLINVAKI